MTTILKRITSSHFGRSFLIVLFGSGGARIISVVTTFVIAHLLIPDEFGQFSFVRTTLEMMLSICAVNFSALATKYTAEYKSDSEPHKLFILFLFSFIICALIGICLEIIPKSLLLNIFINNEIVRVFRYAGILLPLLFVSPLLQGVYNGLFKFKFVANIQIAENLFFLIVSVGLILFDGLRGAFVSIILFFIFRSLIVLIPFLRKFNVRFLLEKIKGLTNHGKILRKEILPMFFMSFVDAPILWLAQFILTRFGGFEMVAFMTVIMQIRNLVFIVPTYFFNTFTSFASKLFVERDYSQYFNKIDYLFWKIFWIISLITLLIAFFGKLLLGLFGPEYIHSYIPYIFGILPLPLLIVTSLLKMHMVINEHQTSMLLITILWNLLWIGLFFLTTFFGILDSLNSFFICQDIAILVQLIFLYIIYKKDKSRYLR